MVEGISIGLFLLLAVNFGISLWNAYAAGYNLTMLRYAETPLKSFFTFASYATLVLSFAGVSQVFATVLSLILLALGKISVDVVLYVSGYSFLVFGTLIVFSGIIITIESIVIATQKRDFWSILISIYNVIASIFNIYNYITTFRYASELIKSGDEREENNALLIVLVSALFAFFVVYNFYKMGKKKAEEEINVIF